MGVLVELVALLLEGRHPDLPALVHQVHREELAGPRGLVPRPDVALGCDAGLDGPLILGGRGGDTE